MRMNGSCDSLSQPATSLQAVRAPHPRLGGEERHDRDADPGATGLGRVDQLEAAAVNSFAEPRRVGVQGRAVNLDGGQVVLQLPPWSVSILKA